MEQRANAFSAEFLLPHAEAGSLVETELAYVSNPEQRKAIINQSVDRLVEQFEVSHETTAWQILRAGKLTESDEKVLQRYLRSIQDPFGS